MTAPKLRVLTHPRSDATVEADRDHVDIYLSQGWVEEALKAPEPTKPDED